MNARLAWLSSIAADPRVSVHTSRFAVAVAALADDRGRLRSRMTTMSDACQIASRHMVSHIERLAELGYIKVDDLTRQGRFAIQIVTPAEDGAPATAKVFREIEGALVGMQPQAGRSSCVALYIDGPETMTKIVVDTATAAALAPAGANHAPAASS